MVSALQISTTSPISSIAEFLKFSAFEEFTLLTASQVNLLSVQLQEAYASFTPQERSKEAARHLLDYQKKQIDLDQENKTGLEHLKSKMKTRVLVSINISLLFIFMFSYAAYQLAFKKITTTINYIYESGVTKTTEQTAYQLENWTILIGLIACCILSISVLCRIDSAVWFLQKEEHRLKMELLRLQM